MAHKHSWTRENSGCTENPGVHSSGHKMIYRDECSCGARRRKETSIIAGNRGALVEITDANGTVTRRDGRCWLYS